MKKLILSFVALCGLLAISSGVASAQSRTEIFGGYSYVHITDSGATTNLNGGTGSIAVGLLPAVSAVGDFGVYHGGASSIDGNITTYLFGPKVQVPVGGIHPFAQVLFGGAHIGISNCTGCSANSFAMALGGGFDADLLPHIGLRLIQLEYLKTDLPLISNRQNNLRLSTGVTFRF